MLTIYCCRGASAKGIPLPATSNSQRAIGADVGSCLKRSAVIRTQTRLLTIAIPHPAASIIDLTTRRRFELPVGTENTDLVCGVCGMVVLAGWSVLSTAKRLVVDSQMLIKCGKCRTYNVVPTARLAEEPPQALVMVDNRLRGLYIREANQ